MSDDPTPPRTKMFCPDCGVANGTAHRDGCVFEQPVASRPARASAKFQEMLDALRGMVGLIQLLPDEQRRPLLDNHRFVTAYALVSQLESACLDATGSQSPEGVASAAPQEKELTKAIVQHMKDRGILCCVGDEVEAEQILRSYLASALGHLEWIASQRDLFFAECSLAEAVIEHAQAAISCLRPVASAAPPRPARASATPDLETAGLSMSQQEPQDLAETAQNRCVVCFREAFVSDMRGLHSVLGFSLQHGALVCHPCLRASEAALAADATGSPREPSDTDVVSFLAAYYGVPDRATLVREWPERTIDQVRLIQSWATVRGPADTTGSHPPDSWQPIETAPKTGILVLLTGENHVVLSGFYADDRWQQDGTGHTIYGPSHWMRWPSPPSGVAPSQREPE